MRQARAVIEVRLIEPKCAVGLQVDKIVENSLCIFGFAIRRQAHYLVLARIDPKSCVVGERRITANPKNVENAVPSASQYRFRGRRRPRLSSTRQLHPLSGSPLPRTVKQRMPMRHNYDGARQRAAFSEKSKSGKYLHSFTAQQQFLKEFLFNPERNRHAKGAKAPWCKG